MARRFGRLWRSVLVFVLLLVTTATYYTLTPSRNASIVVRPGSKVILEDSGLVDVVSPDTSQELSQGENLSGTPSKGLEETDDAEEKLQESETETETYVVSPAAEPTSKLPQAEHLEAEAAEKNLEDVPEESLKEAPEESSDGTKKSSEHELDENGGYVVDEAEKEEDHSTQDDQDKEPEPPAPPSRAVVIGKLSFEETDWVAAELSDWENAIYVVDLPPGEESPTGLRTKMNKAREAMAYLTYIIDNYPDFPDVVAFIHPHRRSWHIDARSNDATLMLHDLKINTILDRGYVNLRCNNEVGCPDEVQPFRDPPDPEKGAEHAFPFFYAAFFNATFSLMQETIGVVATQCCAQFAVSKDQLLKLPKHEYERYRTFLEETHYDDATSGRVMEYMWHMIFERDPVHCENMFDCWCAVYGRCFGHHRSGASGSSHW